MIDYSYLYNPEFYYKEIDEKHKVERTLGYSCYNNAYIVPRKMAGSGVYTEEKDLVEDSTLHFYREAAVSKNDIDARKIIPETVVYLGVFHAGWGHFLTDTLSKLWFLKSKEYNDKFRNCKLVFAVHCDAEPSDNIYQLLEIIGLDRLSYSLIGNITQYQCVVVPEYCFYLDLANWQNYYTHEYKELICTVREFQSENFVEDRRWEKVYFSTAGLGRNNRDVGEEKLDKFFAEKGYNVIYPEKYSVKEQLNILANCRYFASTVGSCSHNIIFLKEHSNVVLIPRAFMYNPYQVALNEVIDLNITYIDSSLSIFTSRTNTFPGPFYYYVSENLKSFFGVNTPNDRDYYEEQFADFREYIMLGGVYQRENAIFQSIMQCSSFIVCKSWESFMLLNLMLPLGELI